MVRSRSLLFASLTLLACTDPSASPSADLEPAPEPAPTAAPAPQPEPTPEPAPVPEIEPPPPPCTELERLAQRACARLDPDHCSSGTCESCRIDVVSWFDLRACRLHGFSQLHANGQSHVVYVDEGQIWVGLDTLDDIDSIATVDAEDPDWVTLEFEEYRSDAYDELNSEFHVIATNVCAVVAGQPRCSKPIVARYYEFEEHYNSAGRTTKKVDVDYSAEVELELGDEDQRLVTVTNEDGDRRRASKRAPKARFLADGEHRLEPLLDRKLVLVETKP